ncbi:DNA-directed RNA polymerase I subunit RPA49 isoform X2 [Eleutherodactylus coqui]|uniref:DNA-directed RNA polymerase I subunit RPA49 isoform X2 n=1 Tax=Eleutherodactylus coqui TaxID=57060 RepID=UPI0034617C9D
MAGKASWEYSGDPERPALLVQFSNGIIQTPENVNFTLYKNKDATKKQRILTAQTERLSYVGKNFSPAAVKSDSLCRYFVGVLNKETGKMRVYDAEQIRMQPLMENSRTAVDEDEDTAEQPNTSYREKVDALIESFGTNKQKRALSSRKLNEVGSDVISKEIVKAAEMIIESKGTAELMQEARDRKEEEFCSQFLPPCNSSAENQESVYDFHTLLPHAEYNALEKVAAAFKNITMEELQEKMANKQHCSYVLQELAELKHAKDIDKQARALWYVDALIHISKLKVVKVKDLDDLKCPESVIFSILKRFTVSVFKRQRMHNEITATMKCKIVSYVLALALHISDFQVDLSILQKDLKITENRMFEIARAMRLKITKRVMYSSSVTFDAHKIGSLELPLVSYKPFKLVRRKTM